MARVTTNDGMPTHATSRPMTVPMTAPVTRQTTTPRYQGQPWFVTDDAEHRAGDTGGPARGQVDLAEQQDEDEAHRDHDDRGALDQQVGEVERVGERVPACSAENTMTAARPGRGWPAAGRRRRRGPGRRSRGRRRPERHPATRARRRCSPAPSRQALAHGCSSGSVEAVGGTMAVGGPSSASAGPVTSTWPPSSTSDPPVISLTTWLWFTSLALTWAVSRPR